MAMKRSGPFRKSNQLGILLAGIALLFCAGCRTAEPQPAPGQRTTKASETVMKTTIATVEAPVTTSTTSAALPLTGVWELITPSDNGQLQYRYTLKADGTAEYVAGWYLSEAVLMAKGTYTYNGRTLSMDLSGQMFSEPPDEGTAVTFKPQFTARVTENTLELTLQGGDEPNFIQAKGKTIAFTKGSPEG